RTLLNQVRFIHGVSSCHVEHEKRLSLDACAALKLPLKEENGKESLKPDMIEIKVHGDNFIHTKLDDSKAPHRLSCTCISQKDGRTTERFAACYDDCLAAESADNVFSDVSIPREEKHQASVNKGNKLQLGLPPGLKVSLHIKHSLIWKKRCRRRASAPLGGG
ncbi:hypothetical protein JOQ06_022137, partial [Pogonophryne albipinna]